MSNCCNWLSLVEAVFAKLDSPWINFYLQNHINKQNGRDGYETYILEYFVSKRNVKMVEFILKENLHEARTFTSIFLDPIYNKEGLDQVLKQVIHNHDTEIVEEWKPYMSIKHYRKFAFNAARMGNLNVLKIILEPILSMLAFLVVLVLLEVVVLVLVWTFFR